MSFSDTPEQLLAEASNTTRILVVKTLLVQYRVVDNKIRQAI